MKGHAVLCVLYASLQAGGAVSVGEAGSGGGGRPCLGWEQSGGGGGQQQRGPVASLPWREHCWLAHWALNEGAGELGTVGAPGSVELQA